MFQNVNGIVQFDWISSTVSSGGRVGFEWELAAWTAKLSPHTVKTIRTARAVADLRSVLDCWKQGVAIVNFDGSRRQWPGVNYHLRTLGNCAGIRGTANRPTMCVNEALRDEVDDESETGSGEEGEVLGCYQDLCAKCKDEGCLRVQKSRDGVGEPAMFNSESGNKQLGGGLLRRSVFAIFRTKCHHYLRSFDEDHYRFNIDQAALEFAIRIWWNIGIIIIIIIISEFIIVKLRVETNQTLVFIR